MPHYHPCDSSVLITGATRNCAAHLKKDVERLKNSFSDFKALHWLLIESDSDDETVSVLAELKSENDCFEYRSLGPLRTQMPLRTQRLAYCRNLYLDAIRQDYANTNIQYIIIADFDGVNNLLTREAIRSCWDRNDWDVCTANQIGLYYDIWALRHPIWSPNDCWEQYRFLMQYRGDLDADDIRFAAVYSRMLAIPQTSEWIEVDSAFGGLAIYKRDILDGSSYCGINSLGEEICEHVTFHYGLRKQGRRIFINPRLINSGLSEHAEPALKWTRLTFQTKKLLRRYKKRHLAALKDLAQFMLGNKGYCAIKSLLERRY